MKRSNTDTHKFDYLKALHIIFFATMMISCLLNNSLAQAASVIPSDYRLATAGDKFSDTVQFAMAFKFRPPRRLRARYVELAIGAISTSQETRPFVSLGPVWRLPIDSRSLFVELGFSPTLIAGSSFNGRDLGGNFHFTSSASVGATFGVRENISVALRVQHTSNGGLNGTNPGLDTIGLNFAFNLSN